MDLIRDEGGNTMSDIFLPEEYNKVQEEDIMLEVNGAKKKNGFFAKLFSDLLRGIYIAILLVFAGVTAVLFIQNKGAAKENEKLVAEVQNMEESIIELEARLEAAEQNRYDRIETKTVQIMKELLAVSDLTTYTYEYKNETTESSTRMLPILGWDILGTTNSVTIDYSGIINVGYNMNNIGYELSTTENCIYVTLPEPEVLDNYIKFDDLSCTCNNNIFNPIQTGAVMEYFELIEAEELEKAEADDIYGKANEQLKSIITGYFGVFPDYEVKFN